MSNRDDRILRRRREVGASVRRSNRCNCAPILPKRSRRALRRLLRLDQLIVSKTIPLARVRADRPFLASLLRLYGERSQMNIENNPDITAKTKVVEAMIP